MSYFLNLYRYDTPSSPYLFTEIFEASFDLLSLTGVDMFLQEPRQVKVKMRYEASLWQVIQQRHEGTRIGIMEVSFTLNGTSLFAGVINLETLQWDFVKNVITFTAYDKVFLLSATEYATIGGATIYTLLQIFNNRFGDRVYFSVPPDPLVSIPVASEISTITPQLLQEDLEILSGDESENNKQITEDDISGDDYFHATGEWLIRFTNGEIGYLFFDFVGVREDNDSTVEHGAYRIYVVKFHNKVCYEILVEEFNENFTTYPIGTVDWLGTYWPKVTQYAEVYGFTTQDEGNPLLYDDGESRCTYTLEANANSGGVSKVYFTGNAALNALRTKQESIATTDIVRLALYLCSGIIFANNEGTIVVAPMSETGNSYVVPEEDIISFISGKMVDQKWGHDDLFDLLAGDTTLLAEIYRKENEDVYGNHFTATARLKASATYNIRDVLEIGTRSYWMISGIVLDVSGRYYDLELWKVNE